ncbi:redoxin family protein [Flavivirga spongiicola]|uniref:Redoxin family protein n=1 Tax=Flavivirga spongiicola TaxID=421621 RepID=A0ABU7XXT5_9FLAO|nr:redoxin family protein [Flavivirga sp. MEBiC05379]MDO5980353.1 redoxin family protein [Flavivirga sp. MEBiC05379]
MKLAIKLSGILYISFLGFTSCKTEGQLNKDEHTFTIEGKIKGLTSNLYYRHPDKEYSREHPSDSIVVTNGKFSLTDSISNLSLLNFYTSYDTKKNNLYKIAKSGGFYPVKSMYLMMYAFPGASIEVSGEAIDFMNAYPSGDIYNNGLAEINKITFPNYNESANLMIKASFEKDSSKVEILNKASDSISELVRLAQIDYIKNHPESLAALWYLENMIMTEQIDDDTAIALYQKASPNLTSTETYKAISSRIEGIEATKEGMLVPSIKSTSTIDGSEFDIFSLRGKYVLIDFWGTWCGPCVEEMPKVKSFQEKYKDQLVVLGINSGDTKKRVVKFLKNNDYQWQQLMSDKANTPDNFVNRFNVKGFPTKFIIDPEGKIVKRYLGSGEDTFSLLEELLN